MHLQRGQTAIVTGAASGIGLALSQALAGRGLNVVMADINLEAVQIAAAPITGAIAVCADVSKSRDVDAIRETALSRFGKIDVACNNAGVILPFKPVWEHSEEDWDWILNINLKGVINGIRAFLPLLVHQRSGHIVNTASMAGVSTIPFNGPYNATKHAVVALTETISAEMREMDIPVSASVLCTGLVSTNIRASARRRPGANTRESLPDSGASKPEDANGLSISADEVARMTIAGIEEDRLHIFTNPGSAARVKDRIDHLVADLSV